MGGRRREEEGGRREGRVLQQDPGKDPGFLTKDTVKEPKDSLVLD